MGIWQIVRIRSGYIRKQEKETKDKHLPKGDDMKLKNNSDSKLHGENKGEELPGFTSEFPYLMSCTDFDDYPGRFIPWHWHKTVELFYVERGRLEYATPQGWMLFPQGSGGIVNPGVLHMTKPQEGFEKNIRRSHIFAPSFIAGLAGGRIEQKYILPFIKAPCIEIIGLFPDKPEQAPILDLIRQSFLLSHNDFGFEIKLRNSLSEVWLRIITISEALMEEKDTINDSIHVIKKMINYIHKHYGRKIRVEDIAAAAFTSERECFRIFHECLHTTPVKYLQSYRLQKAACMLAKSSETVSNISQICGLGSSSYFGKSFREFMGCTPLEYRSQWQK